METKIDRETLVCAGETIQAAHDYIETHGFDIQNYGSLGGQCCYIGAVRIVAGLPGRPGHTGTADPTHGREILAVALSTMDKAALATGRKQLPASDHEAWRKQPGRIVESIGLQLSAVGVMDHDEQQDFALGILRSALREIHKEVEDV